MGKPRFQLFWKSEELACRWAQHPHAAHAIQGVQGPGHFCGKWVLVRDGMCLF